MSTTDTKSHITYANSAFIEASGYKEEHLLGEPHNLIRHPDMPAEAFGDMWFTLQQGETWTGLVKNRRHNGDHYWVRANVTPVWQGGSLTGYISVRNIPAREEIAASEKLYAKVRNNELKHYRFYKGLLVRRGLFSFMSLFKCLSTSKRIHLVLRRRRYSPAWRCIYSLINSCSREVWCCCLFPDLLSSCADRPSGKIHCATDAARGFRT
jgi:aerotaxis receptor